MGGEIDGYRYQFFNEAECKPLDRVFITNLASLPPQLILLWRLLVMGGRLRFLYQGNLHLCVRFCGRLITPFHGGPTAPNPNPKVIAGRPWTVSRWSCMEHMIDFQLIQDGLRYVQLHEETFFSFIQIEWHDWLD